MADDLSYRAFLSYNRSDRAAARLIQRRLERYVLPHAVRASRPGPRMDPRPLRPIFRDEDELVPGADLPERIRRALERSEFLLVVCSPRSARSEWVEREVLEFIRLGRKDRILAVVIEGEPHAADRGRPAELECLPPALRFEVAADGTVTTTPAEPLWVDWRRGAPRSARQSFLRLVAALLELASFDELVRRDAQARARQRLGIAIGSLAALAIIAAVGWQAWRLTFASPALQTEKFKAFYGPHLLAEMKGEDLGLLKPSDIETAFDIAFAGDLNHDGVVDFVVLNKSPHDCGSGGCTYEIWTGDFSSKFKELPDAGLFGVKDLYVRPGAGKWDELFTTEDERAGAAPVFDHWTYDPRRGGYAERDQWYCDGVEFRYCETHVVFCPVDLDAHIAAASSATLFKEPYDAKAVGLSPTIAANDPSGYLVKPSRPVDAVVAYTADTRWFMVTSPRGGDAQGSDTFFVKRADITGDAPPPGSECPPPKDIGAP